MKLRKVYQFLWILWNKSRSSNDYNFGTPETWDNSNSQENSKEERTRPSLMMFKRLRSGWRNMITYQNKIRIISDDNEHLLYDSVHKLKKNLILSSSEKANLTILILKNKGWPKDLRKDLWTLWTGAERNRRNNPNYYFNENWKEDEIDEYFRDAGLLNSSQK